VQEFDPVLPCIEILIEKPCDIVHDGDIVLHRKKGSLPRASVSLHRESLTFGETPAGSLQKVEDWHLQDQGIGLYFRAER